MHVEDVSREVAVGGGRVVKTLGDGVMASFDSALGALRAAAGIQLAVEWLDADGGEIAVDAERGRAELVELAPLDAAVTIRFGLADWVRVMAGLQEALSATAGGG